MDLSRFTCLKRLEVLCHSLPLEELSASLGTVLSSAASHQLEELVINRHVYYGGHSLDAVLAALAGLKDVDAILLHPRFRCLSHIRLSLYFPILVSDYPNASNTSPTTPPDFLVPPSESGLQPGLSDCVSLDNPVETFLHYAERLIRSKIQEGLKQLYSRSILDVRLSIRRAQQTSDMMNVSAGQDHKTKDSTAHPSRSNADSL